MNFATTNLNDFDTATTREWLETNGLGGFASSTIIGLNTRRYHGLLTAATRPPVGRIVMLSKLEETLVIDGRRYELSANQYPDVVHPKGFELQTSFRLDPSPVFTYEVGGITLEKSVFMVQGENTTVVKYKLDHGGSQSIKLEIRPLIAFRDYHSTTHENSALLRTSVECFRNTARLFGECLQGIGLGGSTRCKLHQGSSELNQHLGPRLLRSLNSSSDSPGINY